MLMANQWLSKLEQQVILPGIKVDKGLKPLDWWITTRNILFWFRWISRKSI